MKRSFRFLILTGLLVLMSCHPFKELKPKPELQPREGEYIEILNKDKKFELKKGKKYFMKIPAAPAPNFYLVLRIQNMDAIHSFLTRQFTTKGTMIEMNDESKPDDDLSVYALDQTVPTFYWVVDEVRRDIPLEMQYRYVPIWRFRFETRNAEFQLILARNTVDKDYIASIGETRSLDDLDFDRELNSIQQKSEQLKGIQGELLGIEAIFPPDIVNSNDRAYQDYLALKKEVEDELRFQENYARYLSVMKTERESRGDDQTFVQAIPEMLSVLEGKENYPANLIREAQRVIGKRLENLTPYLERAVRNKQDAGPFPMDVEKTRALMEACNVTPGSEFTSVTDFIEAYNKTAGALKSAQSELDDLMTEIRESSQWPDNNFYPQMKTRVNRIKESVPTVSTRKYGKYIRSTAVKKLNESVSALSRRVSRLSRGFARAARIVPEINRYRNRSDYSSIVHLLAANKDLDFLIAQYPDLDERSLNQQKAAITDALSRKQWRSAERLLKALFEDRNFLNYKSIAIKKKRVVKNLEERLAKAVEQESKKRINEFIELNKDNYHDVEALYNDPAFSPVYELTFSSGGANVLNQRKQAVQDYLNSLKNDKFPRLAIETIYKDFVQNFRNEGVAKARAIIIHGRHYQGKNKHIKKLIAEIDPEKPKLLNEPKNYRRIFVVPVNETQQAQNEYLFRLNLQIPTDAQFPVYDVNIKLPREVAKSAGSRQWYDKMTMNGKVLKNEGRFTITAPTKDNDFICLITPLQVNKTGDNILEVRFKYAAFKVLEVSVMAQRPIIRRD